MKVRAAQVHAQFLPSATVEVDVPGRWIIRVEISEPGITCFGGVQIYIPPGWTVPQLDRPSEEGYVEIVARTDAQVRAFLHVWRWITVQVVEGRLTPGDDIEVHYGGAAGARPPRVSDEVTEFTILVDAEGFGIYDSQPGSPTIRTVPGRPIALEVTAPSMARPTETITAMVKAVDALGNLVPSVLDLDVRLVPTHEGSGSPIQTSSVNARVAAPLRVAIPATGTWRVQVRDRIRDLEGRSSAVVADPSAAVRPFWGDIHGHSSASDGALTPEEYYTFARDISGLDFCALTDHDDVGHNSNVPDHSKFMTLEVWRDLQAVTNKFNAPGRFATLIGYEYSQIELGIEGHRNVYYRDSSGPLLHARDPRCNTPARLFRALAGIDALVIPHHPLHYMSWEHDPRVQRLVEVYSMWGTSEDERGDCAFTGKMVSPGSGISFQAYLARGYRLGVTAGGDNHDSRPGRRGPTDRWRKGKMAQPPGLMAVYAPELTREHIFDALWARRCYGTTGQRILLDFRLNGHWMGEEVTSTDARSSRHVTLSVVGETALARVEIVRNNVVAAVWTPNDEVLRCEWEDPLPLISGVFYYVRVRQVDGGRAWSSPVWVDVAG